MEHPAGGQDSDLLGGHSQPHEFKREQDSVDDFEHLEDGAAKEQSSSEEAADSFGFKNPLEMGDSFPASRPLVDLMAGSLPDAKVATKNFVAVERDIYESPKKSPVAGAKAVDDYLEHYSDSDSEPEPFKQAKEFEAEVLVPKRVEDVVPEKIEVKSTQEVFVVEESVPKSEPVKPEPEIQPTVKEPQQETVREVAKPPQTEKTPKIEVEIIFCKMGLGELSWFCDVT